MKVVQLAHDGGTGGGLQQYIRVQLGDVEAAQVGQADQVRQIRQVEDQAAGVQHLPADQGPQSYLGFQAHSLIHPARPQTSHSRTHKKMEEKKNKTKTKNNQQFVRGGRKAEEKSKPRSPSEARRNLFPAAAAFTAGHGEAGSSRSIRKPSFPQLSSQLPSIGVPSQPPATQRKPPVFLAPSRF